MSLLAPELVERLVCPVDHSSLSYISQSDVLYNRRLRRIYQVRRGIPVLLVSESREASNEEHYELIKFLPSSQRGPGSIEKNKE